MKLKCRCKANKKTNKPWYNETCANLKNELKQLARILQKNLENINIIKQYQNFGKKYKYTPKIQKTEVESKQYIKETRNFHK